MPADLGWKIPDNISYEQAATISVGVYSAAMCMTHPKRLAMTEWPDKVSSEQWVSDGIPCSPSRISGILFRGSSNIKGYGLPFLRSLLL